MTILSTAGLVEYHTNLHHRVSLECGGLQEVRLGTAGRVVAHRHLENGIYILPEAGMMDSDATQLNAVAN